VSVENLPEAGNHERVAAVAPGEEAKKSSRTTIRARFYVPFFVALALLAGTVAYGKLRPQGNVHPSGPGSNGNLNWSNGIFANRAELRAWLNAHGKSYATWAKQHPAALRLIPPATTTTASP
jgi:hypothetical protein